MSRRWRARAPPRRQTGRGRAAAGCAGWVSAACSSMRRASKASTEIPRFRASAARRASVSCEISMLMTVAFFPSPHSITYNRPIRSGCAGLSTGPRGFAPAERSVFPAAVGIEASARRQARCPWRRARGRGRWARTLRRTRPTSPDGVPASSRSGCKTSPSSSPGEVYRA
jgi:hypothetical protein